MQCGTRQGRAGQKRERERSACLAHTNDSGRDRSKYIHAGQKGARTFPFVLLSVSTRIPPFSLLLFQNEYKRHERHSAGLAPRRRTAGFISGAAPTSIHRLIRPTEGAVGRECNTSGNGSHAHRYGKKKKANHTTGSTSLTREQIGTRAGVSKIRIRENGRKRERESSKNMREN